MGCCRAPGTRSVENSRGAFLALMGLGALAGILAMIMLAMPTISDWSAARRRSS